MLKTKKLICQILMIALILGMTTPVFAVGPSGDEPTPYETANVGIAFSRLSNTSAESITSVDYFKIFSSATITLTLQEFRDGNWVTASGVYPVQQAQTKYNSATVNMYNDWQLTKGKNYRLKCISIDQTNGNTFSYTTYSNSI